MQSKRVYFIFFLFFIFFCPVGEAQQMDCLEMLQSARQHREEGNYLEAVRMYRVVKNDCPNFEENNVTRELEECERKLAESMSAFSLKGSGLNCPGSGGKIVMELGRAPETWAVGEVPGWLQVMEVNEAEKWVSFQADANPRAEERRGKITLTTNGETAKYIITQQEGEPYLHVGNDTCLVFNGSGERLPIRVDANFRWDCGTSAPWIQLANQDSCLSVTCQTNKTPQQRNAVVTVSGKGVSQSFTVMQTDVKGQITITWKNGDKYEGSYKDGRRNGRGVFYQKDGTWYEGMFKNDMKEGAGILHFPNGDRYEGDFYFDKYAGQGTFYWVNGNRFAGLFKDGKREGKGTYYWSDGSYYQGQYKNNFRDESGIYHDANGKEYDLNTSYIESGDIVSHFGVERSRFEGPYKDGKKHGWGTYYFANGDIYVGDYVEDECTGQGVYYWKNGDRYEGDFKDGKRTGQGTYVWTNGNRYAGQFKDGIRDGKGVFYYANGNRYEGGFVSNKCEGQGTFYWAGGNKYVGQFKENKREGKGVLYYTNGNRYEGDFVDNKRNGMGTVYYSDGSKYIGQFKNDKKDGKGTHYFKSGNKEDQMWENGHQVE